MLKKIALALLVIAASAAGAMADIPRTINYQGRLTDLNGNIPADGTRYTITAKLYLNNAEIWTGVYEVATKNGYFSILLGSGIYTFGANVDFSQPYELGIRINTDPSEMTPRTPLNSVPYALRSQFSNDMPVGSIIAWHKSKLGTPTLPSNWVECNGQTLNDPASPYHNSEIPNLNGAGGGANSPGTGGKYAMFLRGGSDSGNGQTDQMQGHKHTQGNQKAFTPTAETPSGGGNGYRVGNFIDGDALPQPNTTGPIDDGANGAPRTGTETRPVNMSVGWIMKVR